jgi:hypothetical protein
LDLKKDAPRPSGREANLIPLPYVLLIEHLRVPMEADPQGVKDAVKLLPGMLANRLLP